MFDPENDDHVARLTGAGRLAVEALRTEAEAHSGDVLRSASLNWIAAELEHALNGETSPGQKIQEALRNGSAIDLARALMPDKKISAPIHVLQTEGAD